MQWCEGQNEKMMLMKGWEDPKRDIVLPEESFRFRQDPFFKDEKNITNSIFTVGWFEK